MQAASSTKLAPQPSALVGLCRDASSQNREMFHIMRTMVFSDISGSFDRDFWSVDAVRAAQSYTSVWHAGLAVTEMYRGLYDACVMKRKQHQLQAMEQYGRSVRSILDIARQADISSAEKEAVLLSSILLIGYCCLVDDMPTAESHMDNSLQVFYRWCFWDNSRNHSARGTMVNTGFLTRLYRRFEFQFTTSGRPNAGSTWKLQEATLKPSAEPFVSIMDAYDEFLPLSLTFLTAIVHSKPTRLEYSPTPSHLYTTRSLFTGWKAKFTALLQSRYIKQGDEESILTLQIWSATMEISLFMDRTNDAKCELAFDAWHRTYERVAELADQLYAVVVKNSETQRHSFIAQPFSSSISVAEPLLSCWRYRNGAVRRRIIALLRKWPYQDGSWAPKMVACVIEQTMLLEEESSSTDAASCCLDCPCASPQYICALHRVVCINIQNQQPGKATLLILREIDRQHQLAGKQSGRRIPISW